MTPDDVTQAITQALVQGGATWLVATIVAFLPVLLTTTLMMHLGRPYVLRVLRRCGLRLGADVWWMSYILARDALIVLTFALSWVFFQPNIVASDPLPITGPIVALCLLLTLVVKMVRRVDDDIRAYRIATVFLVIGATLYYVPQVFAVEAASQEHLAWLSQHLVSNADPQLALTIMWASLAGVVLIAIWLFFRAIASANRTMTQRLTRTAPIREPAGVTS
jgi:hypothetical protein